MACDRCIQCNKRCECCVDILTRVANADVFKIQLLQVTAISKAMEQATFVTGKPIFINIRTIIGFSSRKANTGPAHGQPLGEEEVAYVKSQLGFDNEKHFHVPQRVYDYFGSCAEKGKALEREWDDMMIKYKEAYPLKERELRSRMNGKFDHLTSKLPSKDQLPTAPQPTRKSSGIAIQALVPDCNSFVAGSADLLESTFVNFKGQVEFQKVSLRDVQVA